MKWNICLIIMVIIMISNTAFAANQQLFFDDFEYYGVNYDLPINQNGWQQVVLTTGTYAKIQQEVENNYLNISSVGTGLTGDCTGTIVINKRFSNGINIVSFKMRSNDNNGIKRFGFRGITSSQTIWPITMENGNFVDGITNAIIMPYNLNEWYDIKVIYNSNEEDLTFYINDNIVFVKSKDNLPNFPLLTDPLSSIRFSFIGDTQSGVSSQFDIDDFYLGLKALEVLKPSFYDYNGNKLDKLINNQMIATTRVENFSNEDKPITLILRISRNKNVEQINYLKTIVKPNGFQDLRIDFGANEILDCEVEAMVWDDLWSGISLVDNTVLTK